MKYGEVKALMNEWAEKQVAERLKRWDERRKSILAAFGKQIELATDDAQRLALKLGVDSADEEKMGALLAIAAGQRGIVLPTPAALFPTNGDADATGRLAQGADGAPEANAGAGDGARGQPGEATGSVAGQPGGNGTSPQPRGKRSRHSA